MYHRAREVFWTNGRCALMGDAQIVRSKYVLTRFEFSGREGINRVSSYNARAGTCRYWVIRGQWLCCWLYCWKNRGDWHDAWCVIPCNTLVETRGILQCLLRCGIAGLHDAWRLSDPGYCEYWGVINHPLFFLTCDCIIVHPLFHNRWRIKDCLNTGLQKSQ